jgi:hypothetical protein
MRKVKKMQKLCDDPDVHSKEKKLNKTDLMTKGYTRLKHFHCTERSELQPAKQAGLANLVLQYYKDEPDHFQKIFGRFKMGEDGQYHNVPDPKRLQISLKKVRDRVGEGEHAELFTRVDELLLRCEKIANKFAGKGELGKGEVYAVDRDSVNFLVSLADGKNQELHTDYTASQAYDLKQAQGEQRDQKDQKDQKDLVPLFVVCPLKDNAKLRIGNLLGELKVGRDGEEPKGFYFKHGKEVAVEEIEISWNDLLVMHGYAPHGGCGYEEQNVRLHFYLMPKKYMDAFGNVDKTTGLLLESPYKTNDLLF